MHIELRDPLGKVHRISTSGATLGRDPRRCDIVITDRSVSGVHAKVYSQDGLWFLEDLQSSNGTYVAEKRIASPVPLQVGTEFLLFRWGFEVIHVDESAATGVSSLVRQKPLPGSAESFAPEIDTSNTAPLCATGSFSSRVARGGSAESPEEEEPVAPPQVAPAAPEGFFANARSALVYYLLALPRLVVHPLRHVRVEIAQQEQPPLVGVELSAWTFSSLLLGAAFDVVGRVLVALLRDTATLRLLVVMPLVLAAAAAVAGLVMAFTWHPLLEWLVRALGGRSDEHSRSNMAVSLLSTLPVVFLAGALGHVLLLAPLPFVAVAPPLVSLAAILLVLFVLAAWFRYFEAARWLSYVWVSLGVLAAVFAGWAEVGAVRIGLAQLAAPSDVAALAAAPANAAPASTALLPIAAGTGSSTVRLDTPGAGPASAPPRPEPGAGAGANQGEEEVPAPASAATVVLHPEPIDPSSLAAPVDATPDAGAQGALVTGPAAAPVVSSYADYLRKRAAIERAIEADPPLLTRVPGVLALYRKLHSESDRIQEKYARSKRGAAEVDIVTERLRDAEIYDATVELVSELDRLLRTGS